MFFKGSRYQNVGEAQLTDASGRVVRYKKVRFIAGTRAELVYQVRQGDRPDHIAYTFYRDPERFWRVCDLNRTMWPDELVDETGLLILIPPAEG